MSVMTDFRDLLKTINLIEDIVISDITYVDKSEEEIAEFKKRLYKMKAWFTPTSSSHKRRFICELLLNIQSVYAISLILKCIWNCCLKDAVMSGCEIKPWTCYDQTPLDHDRAMQLSLEFTRLEDDDRMWFLSLSPEMQAFALCELLTISGGPIVCAASRVARGIYNKCRQRELEYIRENFVSIGVTSQTKARAMSFPSAKRMSVSEKKDDQNINTKLEQVLKERDAQLNAWDTLVSEMRAKLNVEEINMTFTDGTDRTIWKLNKIDNETIETVDFIQLLPASVGKRILSYIPDQELDNCGRVNKYWSYLVEERRAESAIRLTIQYEVQRLEESLFPERFQTLLPENKSRFSYHYGEQGASASNGTSKLGKLQSVKVLSKKMPLRKTYAPITSLMQLTERIQIRGAADEVIFRRLYRHAANIKVNTKEDNSITNLQKYCALTAVNNRKLFEEQEGATYDMLNKEKYISSHHKRLNLWTTNFSSLYPVLKVASYELLM